uniref:DUF8173 domain-containing protein n=1 Tax=candidate division WOR-3 bacterium TaxID=2052148 RepID=A0A7V3VUR7_UNCW3
MKRIKIIPIITLLLLLVIPGKSLVFRSGKDVIVGADEVINDDLIAIGNSVKILGRVNGDIFASAREVEIWNVIDGSIYTGGARIKVDVKECRSLWAFCGELDVNGNIKRNLLFFGGELKINESSSINNDLLSYGGEIIVNGRIGGRVKGRMGKFRLKGEINSADIETDGAIIESTALVKNNMVIKGKKEPVIDSRATILGRTEYKKVDEKIGKKGSKIKRVLKTILFLSKLIIGLILIAPFKKHFRTMNEILIVSPWKSLCAGFLTIIILPIFIVITLFTIIGIPISIFGLFVFFTLTYISGIIFATGLGEWLIKLFKKEGIISPFLSFLPGMVIISILYLIPYLGFFIRLLVLFFGTGMFTILIGRLWRGSSLIMEAK